MSGGIFIQTNVLTAISPTASTAEPKGLAGDSTDVRTLCLLSVCLVLTGVPHNSCLERTFTGARQAGKLSTTPRKHVFKRHSKSVKFETRYMEHQIIVRWSSRSAEHSESEKRCTQGLTMTSVASKSSSESICTRNCGQS
jgi:hypothetical protein